MVNEKIYWTMKNGKKIDIDQMTKDHLRNILKMIVRNNDINNKFEEYRKSAIKEQQNLEPFCDDYLWKQK